MCFFVLPFSSTRHPELYPPLLSLSSVGTLCISFTPTIININTTIHPIYITLALLSLCPPAPFSFSSFFFFPFILPRADCGQDSVSRAPDWLTMIVCVWVSVYEEKKCRRMKGKKKKWVMMKGGASVKPFLHVLLISVCVFVCVHSRVGVYSGKEQ